MSSYQLYDEGEERWPIKMHLGCGGVYLKDSGTGYVNVDAVGELACARPGVVEVNSTDVRDYYARLDGTLTSLPTRRINVVDEQADLLNYMHGPTFWNKVIALQVLEHFTPMHGLRLLSMWCKRLALPGGVLVVSVPDMLGTLDLLDSAYPNERSFALRHLRGSGRDSYNWHKCWYTQDSLSQVLWQAGFQSLSVLPNIHIYPALVMRAVI